MDLHFTRDVAHGGCWIETLPATEFRWALATPPQLRPLTDCYVLALPLLAALTYAVARDGSTMETVIAVLHAGPAAVNEWLATLGWREAGETLSATLRMAQRRDVVITVRGTPTAILQRFSREELEAAILVQSPSVRRRIKRAFAGIAEGRTVSLTALIKEFEKRH